MERKNDGPVPAHVVEAITRPVTEYAELTGRTEAVE